METTELRQSSCEMRGNNHHIEKERMEDEIITRIDMSRRVIKSPEPIRIGLRVPIIELIAYRAAMTGQAIGYGSFLNAT